MIDLKIEEQQKYIKQIYELNSNKNLKYYILTMGCSLNENDSEKLSGILENCGYENTLELDKADIIVINTCCIRENAEDKLFGKLGELKKLKNNKDIIIAIGGCMMQQDHIREKLNKSYKFYDIIFGTHTLYKFPENLYKILLYRKQINDILNIDGTIEEGLPIKRTNNFQALVTIMYGCNNFCSYCIVPYVRGRERSRKAEDILQEVKELARSGYKEIMLLGQNVNSYMKSEKNKNIKIGEIDSFAKLLEAVCKIDGIERIRFLSPHPKDFTDDVIEVIANNDKICKSIHLPLQSGSTEILNKMNRKYTKEMFLNLVEKMKNKIKDVVFTTDIIVGFPGETEEDFEETLDVVRKVKFEQVYMFLYSKRVGTVAEKMENQVDDNIKHKRFDRLKLLVENQIKDNNEKYLGRIEKVLVEGTSKNNDEMLSGRTDSNKVVIFEGKEELIGKLIDVKIKEDCIWYLKGKVE